MNEYVQQCLPQIVIRSMSALPQKFKNMEQNNTVVYGNIDGTSGRYCWTRYLNIRVIEDTTNGYINATKMCAMYGKTKGGKAKQFRQWKVYNQIFITATCNKLNMKTENIIKEAVTGGKNEIIRGTYVHCSIAASIAIWCGIDIKDNGILQNYQTVTNETKRQKISKSGFVYVITAPMFSLYGKNVYKIGYTENLRKRMQAIKYSILCPFRLFDDHELFDVPLEIIKESISIGENVVIYNIRRNIQVERDNKMTRFDKFVELVMF